METAYMEKLGVGIIGCGWVAQEHIKAYQEDGRSEVRAWSIRTGKRQRITASAMV